jgi:hypothetical protein
LTNETPDQLKKRLTDTCKPAWSAAIPSGQEIIRNYLLTEVVYQLARIADSLERPEQRTNKERLERERRSQVSETERPAQG